MAIAFDSKTEAAATTSTTLSTSHTCSGSDRALVVGVTGDVLAGANDINSVTYNGVAMSKIATVSVPANRFVNLWYLENPASGSNTLTATADTSHFIQWIALSYTGVRQTGGVDSSATNTVSSAASITVSSTVVATDSWQVMVGKGNVGFQTAGSGTTIRDSSGGGTVTQAFDSNGPLAAGSRSLIANSGSSENMGYAILSMAPVVTTNIKTFNGLTYASNKTVNGLAIASVKNWNGLS